MLAKIKCTSSQNWTMSGQSQKTWAWFTFTLAVVFAVCSSAVFWQRHWRQSVWCVSGLIQSYTHIYIWDQTMRTPWLRICFGDLCLSKLVQSLFTYDESDKIYWVLMRYLLPLKHFKGWHYQGKPLNYLPLLWLPALLQLTSSDWAKAAGTQTNEPVDLILLLSQSWLIIFSTRVFLFLSGSKQCWLSLSLYHFKCGPFEGTFVGEKAEHVEVAGQASHYFLCMGR